MTSWSSISKHLVFRQNVGAFKYRSPITVIVCRRHTTFSVVKFTYGGTQCNVQDNILRVPSVLGKRRESLKWPPAKKGLLKLEIAEDRRTVLYGK